MGRHLRADNQEDNKNSNNKINFTKKKKYLSQIK